MTHTGVSLSTHAIRQARRCALFVFAFLCWAPQTLVLNAEQLVQRATTAERAGRVTTPKAVPPPLTPDVTRVASAGRAGGAGSADSADTADTAGNASRAGASVGGSQPLAVAFAASAFGQLPPLSMEAVAAFRAAHSSDTTTDRVAFRPRDGRLTMTTSVRDGTLRELELTLEAETHRIVREVLVFPGLGRVEIEAYTPSTSRGIPARRLPSRDDLDKAELQARLVLCQRHIDMGRAVQVTRTPESVRVQVGEGTYIPFDDRRTAATRIAELDIVRLEFSTSMTGSTREGGMGSTSGMSRTAAAGSAGTARGAGNAVSAARFRLTRWLNRTFADASTRARFGPTLLHSLDTVRQRLTVLADLADRYRDPRHQLAASTRPLLQQLVDLEYQHLRTELNESRELISTLSGTAHAAYDARDTPPSLLTRCPRALARAQTFEQLVRETSASREDLTEADRQYLNTGFAALWQAVYGPSPWRR